MPRAGFGKKHVQILTKQSSQSQNNAIEQKQIEVRKEVQLVVNYILE